MHTQNQRAEVDKNFFKGTVRVVETISALEQENERLKVQVTRLKEVLDCLEVHQEAIAKIDEEWKDIR